MVDKDKRKIIKELHTAHATEITGYFFYKYVADVVADEKGKNVFNHLAGEEIQHIQVVKAIAESVEAGRGFLAYEAALKQKGAVSAEGLRVYPKENDLIARLKKNATDLNAVNIGIEIEEKAMDFYGSMLKRASMPDEKLVLTRLFEMEKGHLKALRWEKESLIKTGFWCGNMEYSVEKETE